MFFSPQLPSYPETRNSVNPLPKPRRRPPVTPDQSIMEMQRTYPDLAFRGRRLVSDTPNQASVSRSASSIAAYTGSEDNKDENKVSELSKSKSFSGLRALPTTEGGKHEGSKVEGAAAADYSRIGSHDDANAMTPTLHITLRAGVTQQDQENQDHENLKPGDTPQSTTELATGNTPSPPPNLLIRVN